MKFTISFVLLNAWAFAQTAPTNVLTYTPPQTLTIKAGGAADASLSLKLDPAYHVNSNTPSDPYLIPLRLTWNTGPLETVEICIPNAANRKVRLF